MGLIYELIEIHLLLHLEGIQIQNLDIVLREAYFLTWGIAEHF